MATTRFDIVAKLPEGAKKNDVPQMLQSLLEDRFKVTTHRTNVEHSVLALVVGKGGLKLKPSADKPVAIDENAPIGPGEMKMDGPDGPVRAKVDVATSSSVIDMGVKGKMLYKMNPATQSMHIDFRMTTLPGLADLLMQLPTQLSGGNGARRIVDMTGIQGNYDAAIDISLAEIIALARASGANIPISPGSNGTAGNVPTASDPGGSGSSITDALQSMGLKLESRKATVEQLVVDHIEKTPTEN
jgi:uncharacterized protein (TIGR03435 family)